MFYHVEIKNGAPLIQAHETLEEAIAAFHYALWYAQNTGKDFTTAVVLDENGATYKAESYKKDPEE